MDTELQAELARLNETMTDDDRRVARRSPELLELIAASNVAWRRNAPARRVAGRAAIVRPLVYGLVRTAGAGDPSETCTVYLVAERPGERAHQVTVRIRSNCSYRMGGDARRFYQRRGWTVHYITAIMP